MMIPASQKMVPPQPASASAEQRRERGQVGEHVEPIVLDRAVD
jgi:hypothetical protein